MAKKFSLDAVSVPAPCPQSWAAMEAHSDEARFCTGCQKHVYNLSTMTRRAAHQLLTESSETPCVRLERDAHGKIVTLSSRIYQIARRAPLAAGVLSATLAFTAAAAHAQNNTQTLKPPVEINLIDKSSPQTKTKIYGIVTDRNGAVISKAGVVLIDAKSSARRLAFSDSSGLYEFADVAPSIYKLEIILDGFEKLTKETLNVSAEKNLHINFALTGILIEEVGLTAATNYEITTQATPTSNKISDPQIFNLPTVNRKAVPLLGLVAGVNPKNYQATGDLKLLVFDQIEAIVPGARVVLTGAKRKKYEAISDGEGNVIFRAIPFGDYKAEITANGFEKKKIRLTVSAEKTAAQKILLDFNSRAIVVGKVFVPSGKSNKKV